MNKEIKNYFCPSCKKVNGKVRNLMCNETFKGINYFGEEAEFSCGSTIRPEGWKGCKIMIQKHKPGEYSLYFLNNRSNLKILNNSDGYPLPNGGSIKVYGGSQSVLSIWDGKNNHQLYEITKIDDNQWSTEVSKEHQQLIIKAALLQAKELKVEGTSNSDRYCGKSAKTGLDSKQAQANTQKELEEENEHEKRRNI